MENAVAAAGNGGMGEFAKRANRLIDSGDLDRLENDYKYDVAEYLAKARKEIVTDSNSFAVLVEKGLSSNLTFYMHKQRFSNWMADAGQEASEALKAIWTEGELSVGQRIRSFCERLPDDRDLNGVGTRTNLASVLLMGLDAERYPPFRIRVFRKACVQTGYELPKRGVDEAELYGHFLRFLDYFIEPEFGVKWWLAIESSLFQRD